MKTKMSQAQDTQQGVWGAVEEGLEEVWFLLLEEVGAAVGWALGVGAVAVEGAAGWLDAC